MVVSTVLKSQCIVVILDIKVDFEDREDYELLKYWGKEQVVLKDSSSTVT